MLTPAHAAATTVVQPGTDLLLQGGDLSSLGIHCLPQRRHLITVTVVVITNLGTNLGKVSNMAAQAITPSHQVARHMQSGSTPYPTY